MRGRHLEIKAAHDKRKRRTSFQNKRRRQSRERRVYNFKRAACFVDRKAVRQGKSERGRYVSGGNDRAYKVGG